MYMYTHIPFYTHVNLRGVLRLCSLQVCVRVRVRVRVCVGVCMRVHVSVRARVRVHVRACVCVCVPLRASVPEDSRRLVYTIF